MQSGKIAPDRHHPPAKPEPADLFDIANLFPATAGLPMTAWPSPRGNARHGVRIKVLGQCLRSLARGAQC